MIAGSVQMLRNSRDQALIVREAFADDGIFLVEHHLGSFDGYPSRRRQSPEDRVAQLIDGLEAIRPPYFLEAPELIGE
jgi:hypothetical protein